MAKFIPKKNKTFAWKSQTRFDTSYQRKQMKTVYKEPVGHKENGENNLSAKFINFINKIKKNETLLSEDFKS